MTPKNNIPEYTQQIYCFDRYACEIDYLMNKRKRVEERNFDTEEDFRARVLGALNLDKSDLYDDLYLFVNEKNYNEKDFHKLSLQEVGIAIKQAPMTERENFRKYIKNIGNQKLGGKRLWKLFQLYCPNIGYDPDFIEALTIRFFTSVWPNQSKYSESRRDDEKIIMERTERLSHVKVCNKSVTIDVALIILSFLPYDYELICTLGLTCEKWFRLILESWPECIITPDILYNIPLSVLKRVKILKFEGNIGFDDQVITVDPFDYLFFNQRITFVRITELDFSGWFHSYKSKLSTIWNEKEELMIFPNCKKLVCGNDPHFWSMMKKMSLPRLCELECYILDLHVSRGLNLINFDKIVKLTVLMHNSESISTYSTWVTYPNFRSVVDRKGKMYSNHYRKLNTVWKACDCFKKSDYTFCFQKLYTGFPKLKNLSLHFGEDDPKGFIVLSEEEIAQHTYSWSWDRKYEANRKIIPLEFDKFTIDLETVRVSCFSKKAGFLQYVNTWNDRASTLIKAMRYLKFCHQGHSEKRIPKLIWKTNKLLHGYDGRFLRIFQTDYSGISGIQKIDFHFSIPKFAQMEETLNLGSTVELIKNHYTKDEIDNRYKEYDWDNLKKMFKTIYDKHSVYGKLGVLEITIPVCFAPIGFVRKKRRSSRRRRTMVRVRENEEDEKEKWVWRNVSVKVDFGRTDESGRPVGKVIVDGYKLSSKKYKLGEKGVRYLNIFEDAIVQKKRIKDLCLVDNVLE